MVDWRVATGVRLSRLLGRFFSTLLTTFKVIRRGGGGGSDLAYNVLASLYKVSSFLKLKEVRRR